MKKLAVVVAAVAFVALTGLAYGDMGGHDMGGHGMGSDMACDCGMGGPMMNPEHHMSKYLMGLNLDEQQQAAMGELKSRMMKETIRRTADMRIAEIELKELLDQDQVDMKAVEVKVKQLETMKTNMQLYHINAMEDCKAKLTPEQRKQLKETVASGPMMGGMEKRHEHEQECPRQGK